MLKRKRISDDLPIAKQSKRWASPGDFSKLGSDAIHIVLSFDVGNIPRTCKYLANICNRHLIPLWFKNAPLDICDRFGVVWLLQTFFLTEKLVKARWQVMYLTRRRSSKKQLPAAYATQNINGCDRNFSLIRTIDIQLDIYRYTAPCPSYLLPFVTIDGHDQRLCYTNWRSKFGAQAQFAELDGLHHTTLMGTNSNEQLTFILV